MDRSQSCVLEAQSEPRGRASQGTSSQPQGHAGGVCMPVVGGGKEWVSLSVPAQARVRAMNSLGPNRRVIRYMP